MFYPGSRYVPLAQYQVTKQDGTVVTVTRLPLRSTAILKGYYPKPNGQGLAPVASHFLSDATAFWRLCDVNNALCPDALSAHPLIGIPGVS